MDDRNSTTSDGAPARPGAEQASEEGPGPDPADSHSAPLSNFGPPSALPFGLAPSLHPPAPPPFGETGRPSTLLLPRPIMTGPPANRWSRVLLAGTPA